MTKQERLIIIDTLMKNNSVLGYVKEVYRNLIVFRLKDKDDNLDNINQFLFIWEYRNSLNTIELEGSQEFNDLVLKTFQDNLKLNRNFELTGNKLDARYIL